MRSLARRFAWLLPLIVSGCGDPMRPLEPPTADGRMLLFGILDPDTTVQPILIQSIEPARDWKNVRVQLLVNGSLADSAVGSEPAETSELVPCILRYGTIVDTGGEPRCLTLRLAPAHGARYRVVVTADDRPAASVEGTVPGLFRILSVAASGDPPGTDGLEVQWTRSSGAWRYVISVRPDSVRGCIPGSSLDRCRPSWFVATADTAVRTVVPSDAVELGTGFWYVDVYAMERTLYEHLTTGTAGDLFSVPPVQNVDGGYGTIGSWVWRSVRIDR